MINQRKVGRFPIPFKINIVAPSRRLPEDLVAPLKEVARRAVGDEVVLSFDDQCFLSSGHFAGTDRERTAAFIRAANDETASAVWFARGGYGSGRLSVDFENDLSPAAHNKRYLGYSDVGFLLADLYAAKVGTNAHGPMAYDLARDGGEAAIERALRWLTGTSDKNDFDADLPVANGDDRDTAAPRVAFNATVLAHALPKLPVDLFAGHILVVEEVAEYHYAFDRSLSAILSAPHAKELRGLKLGRVSAIPDDPDQVPFGSTTEEIAQYWCDRASIPFLGRADIGHDIDNKIVRFGAATTGNR
ncbi:MAG: LD-carboxypeptidase [Pseudomonadota bacterium]